VTTAIAFGLFVATVVTGVTIPVDEPPRAIGMPQDAVFSALAALGYAFLFNVPARVAWACVLCGVASHTTRTLCVHLGIDIISGTLIGALAAGFLAQGFARYFEAPAAAFAFPGVVAMVPGAYAFRAVLGSLQIVHGAAAPPLVTETLSLGIAVRADGRGDRRRHRRPRPSLRSAARPADGYLPARRGLSCRGASNSRSSANRRGRILATLAQRYDGPPRKDGVDKKPITDGRGRCEQNYHCLCCRSSPRLRPL